MIVEIGYLGGLSIYQIRIADGSRVTAAIANLNCLGERAPQQDEQVWLSFSAEAPIVLTR
jgi:putrescine transport system ATP-binding protein